MVAGPVLGSLMLRNPYHPNCIVKAVSEMGREGRSLRLETNPFGLVARRTRKSAQRQDVRKTSP
jgi:hypothetical protein